MKLKAHKAVSLIGLLALSAMARDFKSGVMPSEPPDKEKVSYALGMNLGLELKSADIEVDIGAVAESINDVMEGKPTRLKDSDVIALFNQARSTGLALEAAKDRPKVSYALGMRMAVQLKRGGADVDGKVITQGLKDVLEGKPTRIQPSDIPPLFEQAQAYGLAKQSQKNKTEGEAFLAKNARAPGIAVLASGLQYRILEPGTGKAPGSDDLIFIKYRGTLIDGREFDRNDHFLCRTTGGIKGWQEALQRMKTGSKWQVFVPSDIGLGHEGEPVRQVGPDATLIYELELLSIAEPGDPRIGTGRIGHGLGGDAGSAETAASQSTALIQVGQPNTVTNDASPQAARAAAGK